MQEAKDIVIYSEVSKKAKEIACNNIKKILKAYQKVIAEALKEKTEITLLMPGAGEFPTLETIIEFFLEINPNIKKIMVQAVDSILPKFKDKEGNIVDQKKGITQLVNQLETNLKDKYSDLTCKISYFPGSMLTFYRNTMINKTIPSYDVVFYENPMIGPFPNIIGAIYQKLKFLNSARSGIVLTTRFIKKDTLVLSGHHTETEAHWMKALLEIATINCSNVSLSRNWLSPFTYIGGLGGLPSTRCKFGFVVQANAEVNDKQINAAVNEVIQNDVLRTLIGIGWGGLITGLIELPLPWPLRMAALSFVYSMAFASKDGPRENKMRLVTLFLLISAVLMPFASSLTPSFGLEDDNQVNLLKPKPF